ncbi:hypothetical protein [Gimesia aquarii]|uniref:Uncharacterized protein n=1 Tax=Gimesia aquarii TaxID=2527964 RepID=A0A517VP92_9PLAN|nr:hypothetical protein [Gimesia aquarii]QDT94844.1 hypothetical protein V144x_02760 [Gimesia aquarii]
MKRNSKIVQVELNTEEWLPLSRYAAKEKRSIRGIAKEQLMPLIQEAKRKFPRQSINASSPIDDVN